ncbi:MAG: glycosyltransferase [Phycisphaerales bacterium]|nr:glycosyltransferase [Phycisphaerales bacterium]MCI0629334.1 glycosyltransferase [Phycisphaerales bacterium]MCI0677270.1 glycosyltransferase [Phycisphaerales bacterium]
MRVLMLGWEFPPFIAGGLGTACHGLTKAMSRRGLDVTFVLPKVIDRSHSSHVNLLSPEEQKAERPNGRAAEPQSGEAAAPARPGNGGQLAVGAAQRFGEIASGGSATAGAKAEPAGSVEFERVRFVGVPAGFHNPYQRQAGESAAGRWVFRSGVRTFVAEGDSEAGDVEAVPYASLQASAERAQGGPAPEPIGETYEGDLLAQVERFAHFCVAATRRLKFDVVHAHDWMTYPAGLAIARISGRPLVVHVHSTEFDRSGVHVNQRVYDIERRGMHGAMRVIAVSQLTKNVIMRRYGVPDAKVAVVYNGVDLEPTQGEHQMGIQSKDKIVLYFGRITYQKGPEYFIAAASRVLEMMPNVKFVVAGSGDQAKRMIEMAAELGIGHKVLFTGFLRGKDIKRVFAIADLYVMPSVSEPFGIAPLEAMSNDVPVLISKSSGVSEVLSHALKVDFWDIDDMANKIIAVLRHPPLSQTLREHGSFEVRKITWDGAASRCDQVYRAVISEMKRHAAPVR